MQSAPPPTPTLDPTATLVEPTLIPGDPAGTALFLALATLVHNDGVRIEYGHITDDAHWDATTHTLTLRFDAELDERTYALSEFCRRVHLGPDYSHFTEAAAPRRHLHAVP